MKKYIKFLLIILPFWAMAQPPSLYVTNGATVYVNSPSATPVLNVTGDVSNSGTLTLLGSISGNGALTLSGTTNVPLSSATLGSGYDQITKTGAVSISGATLTVTLVGGYMPTSGTSFTIIDGSSLTGTFSTVNLPALSGGLTWATNYNNAAGTVILTVSTPVCTPPMAFAVTGGGTYCAGGAGVAVGLANSESDVSYQLKKDNVDDGTAVAGTGSAISFGNKTAAGTYTVVATRTAGACTSTMTGSAVVSVIPTSLVLGTSDNISSGTSTITAGGTIVATNQITNANVTYTAGQSVTLQPGFKAEGTVFKAQIGGCN